MIDFMFYHEIWTVRAACHVCKRSDSLPNAALRADGANLKAGGHKKEMNTSQTYFRLDCLIFLRALTSRHFYDNCYHTLSPAITFKASLP